MRARIRLLIITVGVPALLLGAIGTYVFAGSGEAGSAPIPSGGTPAGDKQLGPDVTFLVDSSVDTLLTVSRPASLSISVVTDTVTYTLRNAGRIEGTVTLQGQGDHSGIGINIDGPESCNLTTDATGSFYIRDIEPGTYIVRAEHPYYLAAEVVVDVGPNEAISLGAELRAGDVNNDGAIDAMNLALVGRNVGYTESQWHQP